jgi:hypothetical protein
MLRQFGRCSGVGQAFEPDISEHTLRRKTGTLTGDRPRVTAWTAIDGVTSECPIRVRLESLTYLSALPAAPSVDAWNRQIHGQKKVDTSIYLLSLAGKREGEFRSFFQNISDRAETVPPQGASKTAKTAVPKAALP